MRLKSDQNSCSNSSRVSIYVRNHNFGPSDYYRVIQYVDESDKKIVVHDALSDFLFKKNLDMKASTKKKIFQALLFMIIFFRRLLQLFSDLNDKTKVVVIQRELFPRYMPFTAKIFLKNVLKGKRVIWDFDDNIFEGEISKTEWNLLSEESSKIIVTSKYLKGKIRRDYGDKVIVLPTSDKIADSKTVFQYQKLKEIEFDKRVEIVWTGTASNLNNLDIIFDILEILGKELRKINKILQLNVVCNIPYKRYSDYLIIKNIKWDREKAKKVILHSHIGIMPLVNVEYSKGKGGFKLIQYMSGGLAIVASAVGFNKQIIRHEKDGFCCNSIDEWIYALKILSTNKAAWKDYSRYALQNYIKNFNINENERVWKYLLKV